MSFPIRIDYNYKSTSSSVAVFRSPATDRSDEIFADFTSYAVENWDGYGADPITDLTLANARRFYNFIRDDRFQGIPNPNIAPGADGTIGFEWRVNSGFMKKLFVEVRPDSTLRAYWVKQSGEFENMPPRHMNFALYLLEDKIKQLIK